MGPSGVEVSDQFYFKQNVSAWEWVSYPKCCFGQWMWYCDTYVLSRRHTTAWQLYHHFCYSWYMFFFVSIDVNSLLQRRTRRTTWQFSSLWANFQTSWPFDVGHHNRFIGIYNQVVTCLAWWNNLLLLFFIKKLALRCWLNPTKL